MLAPCSEMDKPSSFYDQSFPIFGEHEDAHSAIRKSNKMCQNLGNPFFILLHFFYCPTNKNICLRDVYCPGKKIGCSTTLCMHIKSGALGEGCKYTFKKCIEQRERARGERIVNRIVNELLARNRLIFHGSNIYPTFYLKKMTKVWNKL